MPVLTTPRRITLYWLMLLLPTLAVGAGALLLLRHEQTRIDEQARAAADARQAAIEARARLIVENVELLVGDVETGLMATLSEAPAANPATFLDDWSRGNPLVRATFLLAGDDRVLWPAGGEVRTWLAAWLASGTPWQGVVRDGRESASDRFQRKDISSNVAQAQSLRNTIQTEARQKNAPESLKKSEAEPAPERNGWTSWRGADRLHLVGWRQPASGGVVGVEVNLETIAARLGELLPRDGDFADAFAVREAGGAILQSKVYRRDGLARSATPEQPVATVPISASVLPGWEVVGFARAGGATRGAGGAFFLVGGLFVGLFVAAILSGGSLLLWQARRSEAEAARKTSFVANVSHEFKTPLTTIRLYAELLEQGRVRDAAQGGEYLRTIGRETQRLARLVNNALDFSRLEQGRKKFARESLDLAAELGRLLDTHAPRIAEAGLALRRELPAAPFPVVTDRDALGQIVLNVLDNACKYAAGGAEVTVSLAPRAARSAGSGPAGGAEVRVADRGPGVPAEHRERIFEKFHRVDDALTAEKSGAGLGLSIARRLARGLGGALRYAPRAGGGAEFILELP